MVRVASSWVANWVRTRLAGDDVTDAGCADRAFRRECIAKLRSFKGMHRLYGIRNRVFSSFVDLLAVRWMRSRAVRWKIQERANP